MAGVRVLPNVCFRDTSLVLRFRHDSDKTTTNAVTTSDLALRYCFSSWLCSSHGRHSGVFLNPLAFVKTNPFDQLYDSPVLTQDITLDNRFVMEYAISKFRDFITSNIELIVSNIRR